jgi:hypothetical protein
MLFQAVLLISDILSRLPRQIIPVTKMVGYEVLLYSRMYEKASKLTDPKSHKAHLELKNENNFKWNADSVI